MSPNVRYLVILATAIILGCGALQLAYHLTDTDCQSRGGHTEWIYGGRGGWTCAGATR